VRKIYEIFKAEVVKELRIRKIGQKELAQMTGYKLCTIQRFMSKSKDRDDSDRVAKAISYALGIKLSK
jgi:hypothetical protein